MSYQPIPTNTAGGQARAEVTDSSVADLLKKVLVELRKMNLYLSTMTDVSLETADAEER